MEKIVEFCDGILEANKFPIKSKPLTDFEQGVIAGELKAIRNIKSILNIGEK